MTEWIAKFLERECSSASLDNEHDRETVARAIACELAQRCKVCYEDMRGKTNRTHYTSPTEKTPCRGSWL